MKSDVKFNIQCINYNVYLYVLYYYFGDVKSELNFINTICC